MAPTLAQAVADVFGTAPPTSPTKSTPGGQTGSESVSARVAGLIADANSLYLKSETALKNEELGAYEADIKQLGTVLQELKAATAGSKSKAPTSTSPTTTTTTPPSSSSTTSSSTTSTSTATSNAVEKPSPSSTSTTVGSA
jgi:hypothetical protein